MTICHNYVILNTLLSSPKCSLCQEVLPRGELRCLHCGKLNLQGGKVGIKGTVLLKDVQPDPRPRIKSGPWDWCFGCSFSEKTGRVEALGIIATSARIVGGERGGGKSTLFLQIAQAVSVLLQREVALVLTEESKEQVKARADRLGCDSPWIRLIPAMGGEVQFRELLLELSPAMTFIDSLQGLAGDSEEGALVLSRFGKEIAVKTRGPVIMSSHVTKDGQIAGKEAVQHVVDAIDTFFVEESDGNIRRHEVEKNRDGKAYVSTLYRMTEKGLLWIRDEGGDDDGGGDDE